MKPYDEKEACGKCGYHGNVHNKVVWSYNALCAYEVLKITCSRCGHAAYRAPLDDKDNGGEK